MTVDRRRALVVDDEPSMRDIITFALETEGFITLVAGTSAAALATVRTEPLDLVVLDVMLPDGSGIDLCRRIVETTGTPVILLTALGETQQRIKGLEAGAADYVAKPFHPRELALRAAGLVGRSPSATQDTLRWGDLAIGLRSTFVSVRGQPVELTMHEFKLLAALVADPGRTLDFARLLLVGWGDPRLLGGREILKTTVYRLRMKLDSVQPGLGQSVRSVRGVGYRLSDPEDSVTDL